MPIVIVLFAFIFNLKRERPGEGKPYSYLYLTCFHHDGYLALPQQWDVGSTENSHSSPDKCAARLPHLRACGMAGAFLEGKNTEVTAFQP